nr:HAMP domain-containing sensor histidine kinase [Streptomyces hoynatensis]
MASCLLLLAVVLAAGALVSTVAIRAFLMEQLDQRVREAGQQAVPGTVFMHLGDEEELPPGLDFLKRPGIDSRALGVLVRDEGTVSAGVLDGGTPPAVDELSAAQVAASVEVPTDGEPHTHAIPGLGDYRLIAVQGHNGDTVVTGVPMTTVQDTVQQVVAVQAVLAAAALLAGGLALVPVVTLALRPLRRVAGTAIRVSGQNLHRGEVGRLEKVPAADTDPRTEVGQVGASLNRLLDHVSSALAARQASETRVRRFVADASHELRTPLASIRGYAELTRRGHEKLPPDAAHALRRVEAEATRMTSLVEDLLLLARLDSGRPLAKTEVDLSPLVVDAVGDARAAGPDHRWRLALPGEPMCVSADPARLQQVLVNLLANARTHTPPGTEVTASVRREGEYVVLRVADDGPGIPPEVLPTVFERFSRGDGSRSRAAGSTGLGLAIVTAVVAAHQGTVSVRSVPGRTEFTVSLPAARTPAPATHPARPPAAHPPRDTAAHPSHEAATHPPREAVREPVRDAAIHPAQDAARGTAAVRGAVRGTAARPAPKPAHSPAPDPAHAPAPDPVQDTAEFPAG